MGEDEIDARFYYSHPPFTEDAYFIEDDSDSRECILQTKDSRVFSMVYAKIFSDYVIEFPVERSPAEYRLMLNSCLSRAEDIYVRLVRKGFLSSEPMDVDGPVG